MKTEKPPFKSKGKFMIYHEDRVYILTTKGERDRLIDKLNFAYRKGYEQATQDIHKRSDKLLEKFGI